MTTDTPSTRETKDTKTSKAHGPLDKATGKRKKKKLHLPFQTAPRRLTPKKMVTNTNTKVDVSVEQQEQEEDEIEWIWGCTVERPAEQDVTQEEERSSTSSGHVIKELRILEDGVALSQPTCSRHMRKKTEPTKVCWKVKKTSRAQYNGESNTISTNTKDHTQDKKRSDHDVPTDAVDDNNEVNKDGRKEQGRINGECDDKIKEQEPDNTLVVKEDEQRVTEEERKKKLGKRLQKDLEKGLRMQKNLHMKLHSQLKSQKDLELMKAILTELKKGLKLQKVVENELRLRKVQGKGLDESDSPNAKVCTEDA